MPIKEEANVDDVEDLNTKRYPLSIGKKYPHTTINGKGLVARIRAKRKQKPR